MSTVRTGVSYFGNRNPRHFVSDLEEIVRHNCTFIVHTLSENDLEFYAATMKELVALSKEAGLECYVDPWGVGRVFGGEAYSSFALKEHDTRQILPDGRPAPAVCLNHPRFREFMARWVAAAVDVGADVLFWDEPHFFIDLKEKDRYPVWYCCCAVCQNKFEQRMGKKLDDAGPNDLIAFRDDCVVEFLDELCRLGRARGVRNAVCLLPFKDGQIGLRDWSRVARLESVDILGTDPYWLFFDRGVQEFVGGFAREVSQLCQKYKKEGQLWIQGYRIPAGREEEIKEAIAVAYSEGIRNFATWSYYGTSYMSYIRSDNPEKVWDILGEVYGELLNGRWE